MSFTFSVSVQVSSKDDFTKAIKGKTLYANFTCDALSKFDTKYIMSPVSAYGTAEKIGIRDMAQETSGPQTINYAPTDDEKTIEKVRYEVTADNSDGKFGYKYDITYSFAWGSTFGYKNPVYVTGLGNGVEEGLKAIDALSNNSLTLKVAVTLGAAA